MNIFSCFSHIKCNLIIIYTGENSIFYYIIFSRFVNIDSCVYFECHILENTNNIQSTIVADFFGFLTKFFLSVNLKNDSFTFEKCERISGKSRT